MLTFLSVLAMAVAIPVALLASVCTANESLQTIAMWRAIAGAALNVALNFFLIPEYALWMLRTQRSRRIAVAAWQGNAAHAPTRPIFVLQAHAMNPRKIFSVARAETRSQRRRNRHWL
jgi:hypothetical protein